TEARQRDAGPSPRRPQPARRPEPSPPPTRARLARNASSAPPRPGSGGSAGFEGLLQLVHEELVDAAGDLLEELLAVGHLVLAGRVVAAATGPLGCVDAVGARDTLAVREPEVRRGAAQVQGLHRRRRPV